MPGHDHPHAFTSLLPQVHEGLTLSTRRNLLKAGLAGLAGLSLPRVLEQRAIAGSSAKPRKAVILLWMAGGPSHIDTWDPKPNQPPENRGPFGVIATRVPGIQVCEHLPRQAAMMDRFTLLRAMDARGSNHEPNTVMQTGNREASPRTNPRAVTYPAIGSVVSRFHGANHPTMPAYAAFQRSRSHLAYAGTLGKRHDPFLANTAVRLPIYDLVGVDSGKLSQPAAFNLPVDLPADRLGDRRALLGQLDHLRESLDTTGVVDAMNRFRRSRRWICSWADTCRMR